MKSLIGVRLAGIILLVSFAAMLIFHIFVLLGYIPPDIVWGGRFGEAGISLLMLEALAFGVTAVFAFIIIAKMKAISSGRSNRTATIGAWVIFSFLALNTIGNLASTSSLETILFTPLTLLLAFCVLRLVVEK